MSTIPSVQKAVLLKEKAAALVLDSRPVPQPGRSQVLVKVTVAALNGHDQKIRDMGIFLGKIGLPAVLANDVVGKVVAVGDDVTLQIGDRIVSQADFIAGTPQNGLQEYAVLDERFSAKIPDGFTDDEAATLPTNLIASLIALFHDLMPAPWTAPDFDYHSKTLLIVGGGSTAGQYAVQLAKLAGIGQIVVVGGNEDELRSRGATHIIDRHSSYVLDRIREIVGDELIYAYDAVNMPEGQLLALNALSNSSRGCLTRLLPMPIDNSKVLGKTAGFELKNVVGISSAWPELSSEFWKRLPGYLEDGKIVPVKSYEVIEGLDAAKINAALDRFRSGTVLKHVHVRL